ncbi:hypothetical protein J6590_030311 [Homalodisca vitripennis]|nr:hypothetical protein J6590_030311 [Homalodisca vitripennis]
MELTLNTSKLGLDSSKRLCTLYGNLESNTSTNYTRYYLPTALTHNPVTTCMTYTVIAMYHCWGPKCGTATRASCRPAPVCSVFPTLRKPSKLNLTSLNHMVGPALMQAMASSKPPALATKRAKSRLREPRPAQLRDSSRSRSPHATFSRTYQHLESPSLSQFSASITSQRLGLFSLAPSLET